MHGNETILDSTTHTTATFQALQAQIQALQRENEDIKRRLQQQEQQQQQVNQKTTSDEEEDAVVATTRDQKDQKKNTNKNKNNNKNGEVEGDIPFIPGDPSHINTVLHRLGITDPETTGPLWHYLKRPLLKNVSREHLFVPPTKQKSNNSNNDNNANAEDATLPRRTISDVVAEYDGKKGGDNSGDDLQPLSYYLGPTYSYSPADVPWLERMYGPLDKHSSSSSDDFNDEEDEGGDYFNDNDDDHDHGESGGGGGGGFDDVLGSSFSNTDNGFDSSDLASLGGGGRVSPEDFIRDIHRPLTKAMNDQKKKNNKAITTASTTTTTREKKKAKKKSGRRRTAAADDDNDERDERDKYFNYFIGAGSTTSSGDTSRQTRYRHHRIALFHPATAPAHVFSNTASSPSPSNFYPLPLLYPLLVSVLSATAIFMVMITVSVTPLRGRLRRTKL